MLKSKLAIWSFILSLISVTLITITLILFILGTFISFSQIERGRAGLAMDSAGTYRIAGAAFILSISAFLTTMAALITSIISLIFISKNKKLTGRGLAISALIISGVLSIFYLQGILYIIAGISSP